MPIYEFYCPDNHRIYSFFARSLSYAGKTPLCPDNAKFRMEKMVSSFAVTGRAKEKPELPGLPDDPRMDAALAAMEREVSTLDENNPDPRHLAKLVRKMSSITGEKVPGEMEEMLRRLEAGEDLDKVESEMGDMLDGENPSEGMSETVPEPQVQPASGKLKALRKFKPRRDPTLYEMSDYLK